MATASERYTHHPLLVRPHFVTIYKSEFNSRRYKFLEYEFEDREYNSSWVETACDTLLFIYFSFKATENLHIDKAINSHNKNTPSK